MANSQWFRNDDAGYRNWLRQHPEGFVLNIERDAHYGKLHAATCLGIFPDDDRAYTWSRDKVCSMDRRELERYAANKGLVPLVADTNCL
jgi:hypothetical protein